MNSPPSKKRYTSNRKQKLVIEQKISIGAHSRRIQCRANSNDARSLLLPATQWPPGGPVRDWDARDPFIHELSREYNPT
ncbi:hypothetical protein RRG08_019111 [Elysia crispata]|uniref:Uncharacterized protein n=1 Tax=Elysia crispata TaxID=231223 RepID=A0AAE1B2G2_9GAST|nr:hypothetical protein RRG08_019111 [Elysia crispata]